MAIAPEIRTKIMAELRLGKKSRELSEKYEVSYPTIRNWEKRLEEELADADIDTLLEYDEVTIHKVADELKKEATGGASNIEIKKVEKLVDDVIDLNRLGEKFRALAWKIANEVETKVSNEDLSMKELQLAGGIVSSMYGSIFNRNTTQVNVMNQTNVVSSEKREIFKASLKA